MGNRKHCQGTTPPTPGPWHTRAGMSGVQITNDAGVCVAKTPCFDRQAQADGALLAASWDLLQAASNFVNWWNSSSDDPEEPFIAALEAAIAKADVNPS